MEKDWYYQLMGSVVGPLSAAQMRREVQDGEINRDTLVRKGPDGPWVLADTMQGLLDGRANRKSRPSVKSAIAPPIKGTARWHNVWPAVLASSVVLVIVIVVLVAPLFSRHKSDELPQKANAVQGQPAAPQGNAVPFVPQQPVLNSVDGYKEIATLFDYGADELAVHGAETKDKVATLWMRIKGISSDDEFGQWLVRLLDRAKQPAADKFEEADRLVAQGQLQFSLSLAAGVSSKTRSNLREVSGQLTALFSPPAKSVDATVEPPTSIPDPEQSVTTPAPVPVKVELDPAGEMTRRRHRVLLSSSRHFIKARIYPPARKNLEQIIEDAPGSREADEAQTMLDSIPK